MDRAIGELQQIAETLLSTPQPYAGHFVPLLVSLQKRLRTWFTVIALLLLLALANDFSQFPTLCTPRGAARQYASGAQVWPKTPKLLIPPTFYIR